jgi:acyl-CoA reductase-like NAD-dependent aldehyde dehydrogenase
MVSFAGSTEAVLEIVRNARIKKIGLELCSMLPVTVRGDIHFKEF